MSLELVDIAFSRDIEAVEPRASASRSASDEEHRREQVSQPQRTSHQLFMMQSQDYS